MDNHLNISSSWLKAPTVGESGGDKGADEVCGFVNDHIKNQFSKRALNIDSSVTEEILKLYIAYKSATNFVDVVPQRSRLRLSIQYALQRDYSTRRGSKITMKKRIINVKGTEIAVFSREREDYISLTDMVKTFGDESVIYN